MNFLIIHSHVKMSGTRGTVQLSQHMADAGADAVMVVTPSYYKGALTVSAS